MAASRAARRAALSTSAAARHRRTPRRGAHIDQRQTGARGVAALVALVAIGAGHRLLFVLHRQNAVADAQAVFEARSVSAARGLARDDLEMIGLAADDAAQRHEAVIGLAAMPSPPLSREH